MTTSSVCNHYHHAAFADIHLSQIKQSMFPSFWGLPKTPKFVVWRRIFPVGFGKSRDQGCGRSFFFETKLSLLRFEAIRYLLLSRFPGGVTQRLSKKGNFGKFDLSSCKLSSRTDFTRSELTVFMSWSLSPKFCLWDLHNKNLSTKAGSGSNMMTHYERFGVCIRWLVGMSGKDYEVLQLNLILNHLNQRKFGWETSELRSFIYFISLHVFTIWLFHHKKFILEKTYHFIQCSQF